MKITYTEVNGRRYAYTCTSERVPGKRNPVSRRVYLGIVDPDTGEIIPKKGITEADLVIDRGFRVKSYGDVALVLSVAKKLSLLEDLEEVFGDRGRRILAVAAAQAVRPSSSDTVNRTLRESHILESLGIDTSCPDRRWVVDTINSFDHRDTERFFKNRGKRSNGRLFLMPLTFSLSKDTNDPLGSIYPQLKSDSVTMTLMTDIEGNLVGFVVMSDPLMDSSSLIGLMNHLRDVGRRPLYISDTFSAPTIRLTDLVTNDVDFILPYPMSSVQYSSLTKSTKDVFDDVDSIGEDGSRIVEECVGMIADRESNQFITRSDPRFDDCGIRLRAFMSYNPNINADAIESVNKIVKSTKLRLNGMRSDDPEASLRFVAGEFSSLLRVSTDRDGMMKVSVRRDAMTRFRQNAGRALVVTSGSGWEGIARTRAIRKDLLDSIHQYYRGSKWMMEYRGHGIIGYNHMFIEFLVIMIYSEIHKILISEGFKEEVDEALRIASTLKLLITPAGNILVSVDRETKKLLKAFGIDVSSPS